jgi:hypothetical protein
MSIRNFSAIAGCAHFKQSLFCLRSLVEGGILRRKQPAGRFSSDVRKDAKRYYAAHPRGAAASRHPKIFSDHGRYVALLGRSIKDGIFGFGSSVSSALHAFDDLYSRTRRIR